MPTLGTARRLAAALLLAGIAAVGTAGCLLVPAPVPVGGPVVVVPRPAYGYYGHHGYGHGHGHGRHGGGWRR